MRVSFHLAAVTALVLALTAVSRPLAAQQLLWDVDF